MDTTREHEKVYNPGITLWIARMDHCHVRRRISAHPDVSMCVVSELTYMLGTLRCVRGRLGTSGGARARCRRGGKLCPRSWQVLQGARDRVVSRRRLRLLHFGNSDVHSSCRALSCHTYTL